MSLGNLFEVPTVAPSQEEIIERLAAGESVVIERIVSTGQTTPEGEWYDQEQDEWVALLQGQAVLSFFDGRRLSMSPGDCVFLAAHERHRVDFTSANPPCVWLAVHARMDAC